MKTKYVHFPVVVNCTVFDYILLFKKMITDEQRQETREKIYGLYTSESGRAAWDFAMGSDSDNDVAAKSDIEGGSCVITALQQLRDGNDAAKSAAKRQETIVRRCRCMKLHF